MERKVELIPHVGVVLDGRTIRLGDTKANVERALDQPLTPSAQATVPQFSEEELRTLELLGGPDGPMAVIGGSDVPPAEALLEERRWYYFDSELRVDFDEAGRVEFIELLGGPDGMLQPVIFGMEVFREEPETVLELLKEKNGPDIDDTERGYSFAFKKLSVGLYRENTPENVEDMIEEAKGEGEPMDEKDIAYEMRRTHWAAIGIGAAGYYR